MKIEATYGTILTAILLFLFVIAPFLKPPVWVIILIIISGIGVVATYAICTDENEPFDHNG